MARDTTNGFNTAEVGYLEGRWADQVDRLPSMHLKAGKRDKDTTLPDNHLLQLDQFIPTLMAGLRLAGVNTAEAEVPSRAKTKKGYTHHGASVTDLLASGMLRTGQELTYTRKGETRVAKVTSDGSLIVAGTAYSSPSNAAIAAFEDLKSVNGWWAWRTSDGASLKDLREQLES